MARTKSKLTLALMGALAAMALATMAQAQVLRADLNRSLAVRVGEREIQAELGPDAQFIPSAEGYGVAPGEEGYAVSIPVPDELWGRSGTLAFRFRPSRTLRYRPEGVARLALAESPVFRFLLIEQQRHCIFRPQMTTTGEVTRDVRQASQGNIFWSHLKGGQWYHLAFAWDAEKGLMTAYLNGQEQERLRLRDRGAGLPWPSPETFSGALKLGGTLGEGDDACRIAVDTVRLYPEYMDEKQVAATLEGKPVFALDNEGRWDHEGALDLDPYNLELVYEEDFDKVLNVVHEDDLFEGDRRVRLPEGKDWVLEGRARAWTEDGVCVVRQDEEDPFHAVLWSTREFPADLLIEFGMSPKNSDVGLTILFLATRNVRGGSPFDLWTPKRAGDFRTYHSGELDSYHISYWSGDRLTANLRKNKGFFMPAVGIDRIGGYGPGPHTVRILKVGGKLRMEVNGKMALVFDDDGETYGPVWREGWIGLRQMMHSEEVRYTHLKVWRVETK